MNVLNWWLSKEPLIKYLLLIEKRIIKTHVDAGEADIGR
jgi:hypothetical protein